MNARTWGPRAWLVLSGLAAAAVAIRSFGPASVWVSPWSSDGAIPVLMSNLDRLSPFELFYWGQDRFGGLWFALASVWHELTGLVWTPERVAAGLAVFTLASAFPLSRLLRPGPFWAVAWWALLVAHPWRSFLFDLCQPYGWQLTLLLWAWWGLRRVNELPSAGRIAAATAGCALAMWTAGTSLIPLLAFAVAEALTGPTPFAWRRWARFLIPWVGGALFELILRKAHHLYSLMSFGRYWRSRLVLDLAGIPKGLRMSWDALALGEARWWVLATVLAGLVSLALVVRARRRGSWTAPHPNAVFLIGMSGFAAGYVLMLCAVRHFQANGLAEKYFTPLGSLGVLGGLVALERLASATTTLRVESALRRWGTPLIAAGLSCAWAWMPAPSLQPEYARQRRIAEALAERAPGAFVASGYWDTFGLAALVEPGRLWPVAHDGQYPRTPFLEPSLRAASWVWVGSDGADSSSPLPDPTQRLLLLGGTPLVRRDDPPLEVEGRRYWPFRSALLDAPRMGAPEDLRQCPAEWTATIDPQEGPRLLLGASPGAEPAPGLLWGIASEGGGRVPLTAVERLPRIQVWQGPPGVSLRGFGMTLPPLAKPGAPCAVTQAHLLPPGSARPAATSASPIP